MTPLVEQRTHRSSRHHDELLTQGDIVSKIILFGAALLSLVLLAVTAAYPQPGANQNAPTYTKAQLDQMFAPIALYPGRSACAGSNGVDLSARDRRSRAPGQGKRAFQG
jgi:hypothetical protein